MAALHRAGTIALLLLLIPAASAWSEVRRLCTVSYQTTVGWSRPVVTEVTFMTGRELNAVTRRMLYRDLAHYALVWFDKEKREVAILELVDVALVSPPTFDNDDFRLMFQLGIAANFRQVNTAEPRRWRLNGKTQLGQFIDRRANSR